MKNENIKIKNRYLDDFGLIIIYYLVIIKNNLK